jgi:hypothetical protein
VAASRGFSVSEGIGGSSINAAPINGVAFAPATTSVTLYVWIDSLVSSLAVVQDIEKECVNIDFVPAECRTIKAPSRPSVICNDCT